MLEKKACEKRSFRVTENPTPAVGVFPIHVFDVVALYVQPTDMRNRRPFGERLATQATQAVIKNHVAISYNKRFSRTSQPS